MPTPDWAKCHVEIYEAPGWLDDCFRSSLWALFRSSASQSFENANDVSGDSPWRLYFALSPSERALAKSGDGVPLGGFDREWLCRMMRRYVTEAYIR